MALWTSKTVASVGDITCWKGMQKQLWRASSISFFRDMLGCCFIDHWFFRTGIYRDVYVSNKLLRKTRLAPCPSNAGSEHSKGSLSKRTKRIGRRVLRRQDTPPTLPANSLFYSSKVWISPFPQQLLTSQQFGLSLTHSRSNERTP